MSLSRPRFTIAQMMAAVLLCGFAFAALRGPSPVWASASYLVALGLLGAAPVVAWARKDGGRYPWAAFAVAGWARLLTRWATSGVPNVTSSTPWRPLTWAIREAIAPLPGLAGQDRTYYQHQCNFLDVVLAGVLAAAVCRFAMGAGRPTESRSEGA
jgi:hypothetical protein